MKKWRTHYVPADAEWAVYHQVVLPKSYRNEMLNLAHEKPLGILECLKPERKF